MTGYESKRAAAQDKLDDDDTQVYQDHDDALTIAYQSGYYDGKKAAHLAQEPVVAKYSDIVSDGGLDPRNTIPPQRPKVLFPTMLRKMWSGAEVQAWLDEHVNKE